MGLKLEAVERPFVEQLAHLGWRFVEGNSCLFEILMRSKVSPMAQIEALADKHVGPATAALDVALPGGAHYAQAARDQALSEPLFKMKMEQFANLSHGKSRLSHANLAEKSASDDLPQPERRTDVP